MSFFHDRKERVGEVFALLSGIMLGFFPVFVNHGVRDMPPLFFAGTSLLLAALVSLVYAIVQHKLFELKNKKAYPFLIMVTLFIVVIPYLLLFVGASKTSGINTSILLLSEIIFTTIFTHFFGEKTTVNKIIGASGIFLGAVFIIYNGMVGLNWGDALIVLSTISFPIGNYYSKKSLNHVSPPTILFFRFTLSSLFFLSLSFLLEQGSKLGNFGNIISSNWPIILFNGLVILGIGKMFWYSALKRLDISKAISLEMTFPISSLIALVCFFGEKISLFQWVGVVIMMVGVYFSIKRKSVDPTLTSYGAMVE